MKKVLSLTLALLMIASLLATGAFAADAKYAWYFSAPHAYGTEVEGYAQQFAKDTGIDVKYMIGADWNQSTEDANLRALVAEGYNNISVFPSSDGASGVFDELGQQGVNVITYGAATSAMTEKFCVATDVQAAAQTAAEDVIKAMGGKGGILNVLEVLSDTNTLKRKAGVEAAIAAHSGDVTLVQQVADITSIDQGTQKISAAISANPDKINGIVCTGNVASSAAVQVLNDYYQRDPNAAKIYLICIDTPDDVMNGIKSGVVYGTIAQNTFAHGYIPLMIMQLMNDGYKKVDGTYFIDSGCVLVTKDNAETFKDDLQKVTDQIKADRTTKYLTKG